MSTKSDSIKIEIVTKSNYSTIEPNSERKNAKSKAHKKSLKEDLSDTLKISIERKINKKARHSTRNELTLLRKESKSVSDEIYTRKRTNSHLARKTTTINDKDNNEDEHNNDNKFNLNKEKFNEDEKNINSNKKIRKDFFGNEIKKGKNKKQKVIFRDQIDNGLGKMNLIEYVDVSSFKKFNEDMSDVGKKTKKATCECKACLIF
jgi:hypothetical protein